jgi:predicted ATPase
MFALGVASAPYFETGIWAAAKTRTDELAALADDKAALFWKAYAMLYRGRLMIDSSKATDATHILPTGLAALQSTGSKLFVPFWLLCLARSYAALGQFDDAQRSIGEAMTTVEATKERVYEAESYRIAGEILLKSPEQDLAKARAHFERALAVAREQQAKSLELRAAMSLARLLRDQHERDAARDLLAPVYGWFTEGFDTLDLKEAKALLAELAS